MVKLTESSMVSLMDLGTTVLSMELWMGSSMALTKAFLKETGKDPQKADRMELGKTVLSMDPSTDS